MSGKYVHLNLSYLWIHKYRLNEYTNIITACAILCKSMKPLVYLQSFVNVTCIIIAFSWTYPVYIVSSKPVSNTINIIKCLMIK